MDIKRTSHRTEGIVNPERSQNVRAQLKQIRRPLSEKSMDIFGGQTLSGEGAIELFEALRLKRPDLGL